MQGKTDDSIDDKATELLDGGGGDGGGGLVVRVLVDGDREETEPAPTSEEGKLQTKQEEKEKSAPKAGKPKRKRPPNRYGHVQYEFVFLVFRILRNVSAALSFSSPGFPATREPADVRK